MFDRLFNRHRGPTTSSNVLSTEPPATPRASTNDPNAVREKPRRTGGDLEAQAMPDADGWIDPYGPAPGIKGWFKLYWHDLVAFVSLQRT
jgi:hypothetical protein